MEEGPNPASYLEVMLKNMNLEDKKS